MIDLVHPSGMQLRIQSWKNCLSALTSNDSVSTLRTFKPCIWEPIASSLAQGLRQYTSADNQHATPCKNPLLTQHSVTAAPWHKPICPATSAQGSNSNNGNQSSERNVHPAARVPVVVVGAGPTGLTLSTLLGKLGIPNLVLDSAAALPNHPQVTGPTNCICLWRALPDFTALA